MGEGETEPALGQAQSLQGTRVHSTPVDWLLATDWKVEAAEAPEARWRLAVLS